MTDPACGRCGKNPADGFAEINGTRYCHGDNVDDGGDTCYVRTALIRSQSVFLPEHTADELFDCSCFEGYESYWTCPDCGNEKPRVDYRAPSCRCGATMILEVAEA